MFGTEFDHCGRAASTAGRRGRRQLTADTSHQNHGEREEAVPRKSTPIDEGTIRRGAGIDPRTARQDRW